MRALPSDRIGRPPPTRRRRRRKVGRGRWRRVARWIRNGVLLLIGLSVALVLPMRWVDPTTSAFMLQDDSGVEPLRYEWLPWDELGSTVVLAVVAAEDQRFADHHGLDFKAIRKAVDEQDERGYLRGASTITQQTVKNLYLWPGRSFLRKGLEAWLTVLAELCLPKRRILEIYLNIAEFGPGVYGAGAASALYFGRPPAALSDRQAAALASVLPNPRQWQVNRPSDSVRERQAWIVTQLERLRREGWLTRID